MWEMPKAPTFGSETVGGFKFGGVTMAIYE